MLGDFCSASSTWFWMENPGRLHHTQCTDKPQHKHYQQKSSMRTDAFVLIARFFGGFKPSTASYLRLHFREWHLYSIHSYKIPYNCMQIECFKTSHVVLKTLQLQNNCNSKSVEQTKLHPLMFYAFPSWPKGLWSAAWKCPFPQQNQFGAGVRGLTYPE